jgi:SagB-type dehydrogenase family enzyme
VEKTIGQQFMAGSRLVDCQNTQREQKLPPPEIEEPYDLMAKLVKLPEPDLLLDKQVNFLELIELRTTVRQFHQTPLTLSELSYLLWCTQGVKMTMPGSTSIRTVPSAGARHAFETYLYIQKVEGIEPGLYRFLALEHALLPVELSESSKEQLLASFKARPMVENSAVTFMWSAVLARMEYAFGQRAYRYIHIDAGHVCQNLYLAGQTARIGVCAIGAFDDEKLNASLGFTLDKQFVVYGAAIGK